MATSEISIEQIGRNNHAIANSVRQEMQSLHPLSDERCIYRVPQRLRQLNEKFYTPQVVSIGPIHHGREEFKAMEEHKRRYLKDFLQRTNVSLEDFVKLIQENEATLRNYYAESFGFNNDDFVKIILVDAVFIIEVLMRWSFDEFRTGNDHIYDKPWMIFDVRPELCLLENQLPFFIVEEVFRLSNIAKSYSLFKLTHKFLYDKLLTPAVEEPKIKDLLENNSSPKAEHLVDLLRIFHRPPICSTPGKFKTLTIPSVTELHQAGVKLKLASSKNPLDIQFNDGILEIPKLLMQDDTELILKNLLVFERCHCLDSYTTDYVTILSHLVNAPKDVDLLVQNGILENFMENSEAVSTVLHNLSKLTSINTDHFYFAALVEDLNVYCRSPWHKWKATLKQDYFNTPWAAISVIAAVIILFLTFIQTVCSIISV